MRNQDSFDSQLERGGTLFGQQLRKGIRQIIQAIAGLEEISKEKPWNHPPTVRKVGFEVGFDQTKRIGRVLDDASKPI